MLRPYLPPAFREYLERAELPGGRGSFPHAHRPWLHPEDYIRVDAAPPGGGPAGSDHAFMAEQLLDRYDIDVAVLTGEEAIEVSTLADAHYAQALARAYNEWLVEEWLARDARLRGSLVVAPQDPHGAAAEIRRRGEHPASCRCSSPPGHSGRTGIPSTIRSGRRAQRSGFRSRRTSAVRVE